ncbi:MAG: ABC transporter substrate-binding protein [Neomegalonema sp.]|nr:ABC transporter substrate-binding protein [Neomegalonema sp.]
MFRTLLAAGAAALISLAGAPAIAKDKLTVLLDWFVNPDHGPLIIAAQKGYFTAAGLEVELIAPADPSLPPRMVAAGKADVAISYQPQLHLQKEAGLDLIRVGTLVATPLNCLLTLADGPIKTLADLKGRKVGFSVAGVEKALMTALLRPVGLKLDDVQMIDVGVGLSPALMSGQVDAVIGAFRNFELTQLKLEGMEGRCFYLEEHGAPVYEELIYVARASVIAKDAAKRDAVRRFLRATERATLYMINHPKESWELFKSYKPELDDKLNKAAWFDTLPRFALRPMAVDPARYAAFSKFLADAGLIKKPQPVETLIIDLGALK